MAKLKFDLTGRVDKAANKKDEEGVLEDMTQGLPDPARAKIDSYKFDRRVQIHFQVPEILKKEFLKQAKELNKNNRKLRLVDKDGKVNQKKFFYYCLRLAGVNIPEDDLLDARMRVRK